VLANGIELSGPADRATCIFALQGATNQSNLRHRGRVRCSEGLAGISSVAQEISPQHD